MSALAVREEEVAAKLALLRTCLSQSGALALRLRGTDWFAWITAGGSNVVLQTAEVGVAEVLVTAREAVVLTDEIEVARLRAEEVPAGFTFHVSPWDQVELRERYVLGLVGGQLLLSDRPHGSEQALPAALRQRRLVLMASEQARYRVLGRAAAEAMSETLRAARPDWSEFALAAAGAAALWRRGIHPALVLVAGEHRLPLYRHPTPSSAPLGTRAMLVFCARRHGLYANLTRFVSFGPAPLREQLALLEVEATGLAAIGAGKSLAAVYHAFAAGYHHADQTEAIHQHHQGGITGYLSREIVATASTATGLDTGMAFAFNPSLVGHKVEDTFLLGAQGLENLTLDPAWPAVSVQGRQRPLWLEVP